MFPKMRNQRRIVEILQAQAPTTLRDVCDRALKAQQQFALHKE
ncbi:hypothetical protein P6F28_17830 [Roseicyclus marinus]|nr:hypothetical protein [Roseicyclus marinus]MDG3043135.1 hypothetical protein [Roseicyclus marinus]